MNLRLALLVLLFLPGCAGGRSTPATTLLPPPPPPVTLEEALAAYEAYCASTSSIRASGDLDVRDQRTGKVRSLGVRLVAARGGKLYLKGSVAVVTALEVVADGQRFWFQVPSKKTVWTGPAQAGPDRESGAEEGQAPYYALRPADVLRALLPEPLAPGDRDTLTMESDARLVSLSLSRLASSRGAVRRRVSLTRPGLRPAVLRDYDAQGELSSEIVLSGWEADRPRLLEVRRPWDGYEARLRLDDLQVNGAVPERAFAPRTPAEYKTVEVR